jgi:hypothetical protein
MDLRNLPRRRKGRAKAGQGALIPYQAGRTALDKKNSFRYFIRIMVEAMVFPARVQKNDEESLAAKT